MNNTQKFARWARLESFNRGMICHFYISESQVQYYDDADFAYFNLLSGSRDWIVKGTPGHGLRSARGKVSRIPCLNCFEVGPMFYKALKDLQNMGNDKYEFGIILNRRKLNSRFDVINVSTEWPGKLPPPDECHRYDNPRARFGALRPFNYCNVVRVEIPRTELENYPIAAIPGHLILGILCKSGMKRDIAKLLKQKKMESTRIFPIL